MLQLLYPHRIITRKNQITNIHTMVFRDEIIETTFKLKKSLSVGN